MNIQAKGHLNILNKDIKLMMIVGFCFFASSSIAQNKKIFSPAIIYPVQLGASGSFGLNYSVPVESKPTLPSYSVQSLSPATEVGISLRYFLPNSLYAVRIGLKQIQISNTVRYKSDMNSIYEPGYKTKALTANHLNLELSRLFPTRSVYSLTVKAGLNYSLSKGGINSVFRTTFLNENQDTLLVVNSYADSSPKRITAIVGLGIERSIFKRHTISLSLIVNKSFMPAYLHYLDFDYKNIGKYHAVVKNTGDYFGISLDYYFGLVSILPKP